VGYRNGGSENNQYHQPAKGLELPLQAILSTLPLELQPRVRQPDVGHVAIAIPLEKILSQLSRGSVKVSFGELRQAFPGVFSRENDRDGMPVPLPLAEILARLNPALIARRRSQKVVQVPAEISSPFDPRTEGLFFSVGPNQAEPAPIAAPVATPVYPSRQTAPSSAPHAMPHGRSALTSAPTPPPPSALPVAPATMLPAGRPMQLVPMSSPPAEVAPIQPAQPSPVTPQPVRTGNPLVVSLTALAEAWPDAVRKEVVQLNLVDAKVALPTEVVETALKQGRVAFSWKTLRAWIKPAPSAATTVQENTVVELPLKVIAPLFLARQREAVQAQQKVAVDADIPNLFFGFPQAETNGHAPPAAQPVIPNPVVTQPVAAKPADTNYYVWDDSSDTVQLHEAELRANERQASPGTRFVSRCATPNEVVARASALDGVAGALIALPDGLMVANRLSPELNGDTLAAFLPQIFSKMSQCTKELRMGELNNLNFTVGNIPWKVFRVNAIFFAAFGTAGQPLPTPQLAALAAELDHKNK
jgi:predicted regulator of Ras-like GTPase activity (Roadblock/LC7/MglB family)